MIVGLGLGRIAPVPPMQDGGVGTFLLDSLRWPVFHMWFVWTLLVLSLLALGLSRLPARLALVLTLVPAVLVSLGAVPADAVPMSWRTFELTLLYAPLFMVGALMARPFIEVARSVRTTWWALAWAGLVFVAANIAGKALWPSIFD